MAKKARKVGRPSKRNPIADYRSLGTPPDDPVAARAWMYRLLMTSLEHVCSARVGKADGDPDVEFSSEAERRHEMRDIVRLINNLGDVKPAPAKPVPAGAYTDPYGVAAAAARRNGRES